MFFVDSLNTVVLALLLLLYDSRLFVVTLFTYLKKTEHLGRYFTINRSLSSCLESCTVILKTKFSRASI